MQCVILQFYSKSLEKLNKIEKMNYQSEHQVKYSAYSVWRKYFKGRSILDLYMYDIEKDKV